MNLTKETQQLHLHPCILTTIWLGLSAIHHDTQYPDTAQELPVQLQLPLAQQTCLRWGPTLLWMRFHCMDTGHQHTSPTFTTGWRPSYDSASQDNLELCT